MGREGQDLSSRCVTFGMASSHPCGEQELAVWSMGLEAGKEVWVGDGHLVVAAAESAGDHDPTGGCLASGQKRGRPRSESWALRHQGFGEWELNQPNSLRKKAQRSRTARPVTPLQPSEGDTVRSTVANAPCC